MKSNVKPWLYGPNWQGRRCEALTRKGTLCQRPGSKQNGRCKLHGGKSTGPQTQAGRDKLAQLHLKHGKLTKQKRQEAKKRAEVGREVRAEVKRIEARLIEQGVLERNWRKDWKL